MSQPAIHGLFPVPFMHRPGLLNADNISAFVRHFDELSTVNNAKSELLAHTQVIQPDADSSYKSAVTLLQPLLKEFGALLFGERLEWDIRGMWMNRLQHGGQQSIHSHANSFISGVIYLTPCHPSAKTVFYRGMGGREFTFSNDHPGSRPGPFNSPKWAVPDVSPGDLVLFPSYMLHEVPKNQGQERMTVAFNAVPQRLKSWDYEIRFG